MRSKRKASLTSAAATKAHHPVARSHRATQAKISSYHTLLKRKHQVERDLGGDIDANRAKQLEGQLSAIDTQLQELGGLASYQAASICGQSRDRGGDSAKVFVAWLKELGYHTRSRLRSVLHLRSSLMDETHPQLARDWRSHPEQLFFMRPMDRQRAHRPALTARRHN